MKTFEVTLTDDAAFRLYMYGGDSAPTPADIRAALKRRGLFRPHMACSVSVVQRPDFGDGKIRSNPRPPSPRNDIGS